PKAIIESQLAIHFPGVLEEHPPLRLSQPVVGRRVLLDAGIITEKEAREAKSHGLPCQIQSRQRQRGRARAGIEEHAGKRLIYGSLKVNLTPGLVGMAAPDPG